MLNGEIIRPRKHAFHKRLLFTIGRKDTVWKTDVFFFSHVIYSSTLIPLCFVVPWHFQVKGALILSCAVFILYSLPCFFFCTLMKSPQKTQNVGFLDCFLPPYCKKKYLYNTIDVYATSQPDLVSQMKASDPVSGHSCVSAQIQYNERQPQHAQRKSEVVVPDFSSFNWLELQQVIENASLLEKVQGIQNADAAWKIWKVAFVECIRE